MVKLIGSIGAGVPKALVEITKLGPTLTKRTADVLAYFDRPRTSNGPHRTHQRTTRAPPRLRPRLPEANNYVARGLLETGGFRPDYTPDSDEPVNPLT